MERILFLDQTIVKKSLNYLHLNCSLYLDKFYENTPSLTVNQVGFDVINLKLTICLYATINGIDTIENPFKNGKMYVWYCL